MTDPGPGSSYQSSSLVYSISAESVNKELLSGGGLQDYNPGEFYWAEKNKVIATIWYSLLQESAVAGSVAWTWHAVQRECQISQPSQTAFQLNIILMKLSLTLTSLFSAIQVLGKCETLKMIPWNPQYAVHKGCSPNVEWSKKKIRIYEISDRGLCWLYLKV